MNFFSAFGAALTLSLLLFSPKGEAALWKVDYSGTLSQEIGVSGFIGKAFSGSVIYDDTGGRNDVTLYTNTVRGYDLIIQDMFAGDIYGPSSANATSNSILISKGRNDEFLSTQYTNNTLIDGKIVDTVSVTLGGPRGLFDANNLDMSAAFFNSITSQEFQLTFNTSGIASSIGGTIDSLSVTAAELSAVPLPPAAWAFGTALIGAGVMSRRKKKAAQATA